MKYEKVLISQSIWWGVSQAELSGFTSCKLCLHTVKTYEGANLIEQSTCFKFPKPDYFSVDFLHLKTVVETIIRDKVFLKNGGNEKNLPSLSAIWIGVALQYT